MTGTADWTQSRRARRILVENLIDDRPIMKRGHEVGNYDHYRDWLIARAGSPMRRAILKAEARYQALHPDHRRLSALHRAYRSKRR